MTAMPQGGEVRMTLDRLSANRDFKRFVEWLQQERQKAADALLHADDTAVMQRCQGKVLALNLILNTIRDASEALRPKERNGNAF